MEEQRDVADRISGQYAGMSKNQKAIAEFILEHMDQAVFMTAAKLGEALGISESTVVRFAARIGYAGYPEFQKALEERVRGRLNSIREIDAKYGNSSQSELLTSVMTADLEKLHYTMEH